MGNSGASTKLKALRERRGLAAAELAKLAAVSRQTIYSIEEGSYVPNTIVSLRLARALDARVEDIFQLEAAPEPARGISRAVLLQDWHHRMGRIARVTRIGDRVVAVPQAAFAASLPLGNARINDHGVKRKAGQKIAIDAVHETQDLVIAGCDPALSVLERALSQSGIGVLLISCGSRQALRWLQQGYVHLAGCHLLDSHTGEHNLPMLRHVFPEQSVRAVTFASWEQGLLTVAGNPKTIRSVADLSQPGISIVNRERGSGSRQLLDSCLRSAGLASATVAGYDQIAGGHLAAARRVATGKADCCVASRAAASLYGLHFISLQETRFELCFSSEAAFIPPMRTLLDVLNGAWLRSQLHSFAGYDTATTGELRQS